MGHSVEHSLSLTKLSSVNAAWWWCFCTVVICEFHCLATIDKAGPPCIITRCDSKNWLLVIDITLAYSQGCSDAGTWRNAIPANIFEPERRSGKYCLSQPERWYVPANRVVITLHTIFGSKIIETGCQRISYFKAKMHQIQFPLGLRPRHCWGSVQRSPRPPSWV